MRAAGRRGSAGDGEHGARAGARLRAGGRLTLLVLVCAGPSLLRAETAPDPETLCRSRFLEGVSAYREGRLDEAVSLLEASLGTPTPWEAYTYYYLLQAARQSGNLAETIGLCQGFRRHFPESLLTPRVVRVEVQSYQQSGAHGLACRLCEQRLGLQEDRQLRLLYGRSLEVLGRDREAFESHQKIRTRWPRSREAREAKKRARRIAAEHPEVLGEGPRTARILAEADLCMREGDERGALVRYRRLLSMPLTASQRRQVLGGQVIALVGTGSYTSARGVLRTLQREFPGSSEEIRGLLSVGRGYWRRDRNREAYPLLARLVDRYTDTPEAMRAAYILGRIHTEQGDLSSAIRQFRRTRFLYPGTSWEREAAWWEAWCHYRRGDYVACARHLESCEAEDVWIPVLVPRARYWLSRCLEKSGNECRSRELYRRTSERHPWSFYGLMADRRLAGRGVTLEFAATGQESPLVTGVDGVGGLIAKLGDPVVPLLLEAGLEEEAVRRLNWLREGNGATRLTTGEWVTVYAGVGEHLRALRIAKGAGLVARLLEDDDPERREENLDLLRRIYPLRFWELIRRMSEVNDLDPFLVAGLIHQESQFMPGALSPAGAVGLMQIMPATGRRVAGKMGLDGFRTSWLRDPEMNIRIGTAYLSGLVQKYDRDWSKVLAAYNAGPYAVAKWTRSNPGAELDEFVEGILYRETRIYVKKVLYNGSLYRKLYGGGS